MRRSSRKLSTSKYLSSILRLQSLAAAVVSLSLLSFFRFYIFFEVRSYSVLYSTPRSQARKDPISSVFVQMEIDTVFPWSSKWLPASLSLNVFATGCWPDNVWMSLQVVAGPTMFECLCKWLLAWWCLNVFASGCQPDDVECLCASSCRPDDVWISFVQAVAGLMMFEWIWWQSHNGCLFCLRCSN